MLTNEIVAKIMLNEKKKKKSPTKLPKYLQNLKMTKIPLKLEK